MNATRFARAGAIFYALWGLLHVAGGLFQLSTLKSGGGTALTAAISSAAAVDPAVTVPSAAAAFMGMGAANIALVGAIVATIALLNWRNHRTGYWINLILVAGTDLNLAAFLLAPGVMAWSDGMAGLGLFAPAAIFTTLARLQSRTSPMVAVPVAA